MGFVKERLIINAKYKEIVNKIKRKDANSLYQQKRF